MSAQISWDSLLTCPHKNESKSTRKRTIKELKPDHLSVSIINSEVGKILEKVDNTFSIFFSAWNAIQWSKFYWLQIGMVFNCWAWLDVRKYPDWPQWKWLIIIYWWSPDYYWSMQCPVLCNKRAQTSPPLFFREC